METKNRQEKARGNEAMRGRMRMGLTKEWLPFAGTGRLKCKKCGSEFDWGEGLPTEQIASPSIARFQTCPKCGEWVDYFGEF